jgi:tetratricopeptide (TPR) repeat protein
MSEGRFQQALELAKQLYKSEPTAEYRTLLQQVYLGRARQLRAQGQTEDALTVLHVALGIADPAPEWLGEVAKELAVCGDVHRALETVRRLPEGAVRGSVLANAVDAALQQEAAGKRLLPEEWHADFDRILTAFAQVGAGQDEALREALQGIGLRSPFVEWKLLLRGLQAYYQKDDVRALENWQRLDSARLPARLAAPFRFQIDSAYRAAQLPATQNLLQRMVDRLQSSGVLQQLRAVQAALHQNESLAPALRLAESAMLGLQQRAPQLAPRLASAVYWTLVAQGTPADVPRFQRAFGQPHDDPHFDRLKALSYESAGELTEAHKHWQEYERWLATRPAVWPGGQADKVRAMIWCRMGNNAASIPDAKHLKKLPAYLCDHEGLPRSLKPGADECFRQALELDPEQRDTYEALFHYHLDRDQEKKAAAAGERLLQKFPDHVPTLQALGDLRMRQGNYDQGIEMFGRALQVNPLDRQQRTKLGSAHVWYGRSLAEQGDYDKARAQYRAALAHRDSTDDFSVLSQWAACEFKAGDTAKAEELLARALTRPDHRLAVAHLLLIESARLKLSRTVKQRFNKEFNESLAETPTGSTAAAVAEALSAQRATGATYYGQKTHEKKIFGYLDRATRVDLTEKDLERVCAALEGPASSRLLKTFASKARRQFPENPFFPFMEAEAYIAQGRQRCPAWTVRQLLETARSLAGRLAPDPKQQALLQAIQAREEMVGHLGPFGFMSSLNLPEDLFWDDEDDEDDDDGWYEE